jgi:hypothetical protein
MSLPAHDPRGWAAAGTWSDERRDDALARTPPFGRRLFAALFGQRPDLRPRARFLRWSMQPDDVYAVFDWPGGGAGVQLDAALEYVIVWGADGVPTEYGDWGAGQVPPAVAHLLGLMPPGVPEDAEPGTAPDPGGG